MAGRGSGRRKKRPPPKITREYLMACAVRYLGRYAASRARTRRTLWRRVDKSMEEHGGSREAMGELVESVLDRLEELGALNDDRYAQRTAEVQRKRGNSTRAIRAYLRERGVASELVDEVLSAEREQVAETASASPDLVAAATYVRKRRLGPYRRTARHDQRQRDLARLARRGFSFDVARTVIDAESVDSLVELVDDGA